MKRISLLLIRVFPFMVFSCWCIELCSAFSGNLMPEWFYSLFSFPVLSILPIWLITKCESHYHCICMRCTYGSVLTCEAISISDATFNIVPTHLLLLYILSGITVLSISLLLLCSITHFVKATRLHYK